MLDTTARPVHDPGMTAHPYDFSVAKLQHLAQRIVENVDGVNRVLLDITPKPPATIEWE